MTTQEQRASLKRRLKGLQKRLKEYREAVLESWYEDDVERTREKLVKDSGPMQKIIKDLLGVQQLSHPTSLGEPWLHGLQRYSSDVPSDFEDWSQQMLDDVSRGLGTLDMEEVLTTPGVSRPVTLRPKIFIAHGGQPPALTKLKEFLTALGCEPIIAEEEPSEARSVDQQVEWCLDRSDCAIVLATAEDAQEGKLYARPNVHIELGRFQERFSDKTIYLLEQGAQFPSNVSEKVWEHFTQDNMERAFLKVVRELTAFGYLKAGVPK